MEKCGACISKDAEIVYLRNQLALKDNELRDVREKLFTKLGFNFELMQSTHGNMRPMGGIKTMSATRVHLESLSRVQANKKASEIIEALEKETGLPVTEVKE